MLGKLLVVAFVGGMAAYFKGHGKARELTSRAR